MRLQAGGGCNLLKAMKMVMNLQDVDSVCLVLGSVYVSIVLFTKLAYSIIRGKCKCMVR